MLYLVSSSPTRAKILQSFGVEFAQKSCGFDEESIEVTCPREFVYKATMGKFEWAKKEYSIDTPVLCADTVVSANGEILRKPKDKEDAKKILLKQSGGEVDIITCTAYASNSLTFIDLSVTEYFFKEFDAAALEAYLDSNEWDGKAGGCMVEGFCKEFIVSQHGFDSCAMGLTIEKLLPFLQ
jgi:septum formation protein